MKKLFLGIAVLLALGMMASVVFAAKPGVNGKHYNLNILGKDKDMDVGDTPNRHTIMVKLNGKTKIIMTQAEDDEFKVLDPNGTDGKAEFELAAGYYNVYAKALGKPGGKVKITSWGEFKDALEGSVLLWLGSVNLSRDKGKPQSVNINELFYVDVTLCIAVDPVTGLCTQQVVYKDFWVFDIDELIEYYWDYDNDGLRLLQVRFYPCTLDCTGTAPDYCRWPETTEEFPDGLPICSEKTIVDLAPPKTNVNNVTITWGDIKK
jgi:hypothetical protein